MNPKEQAKELSRQGYSIREIAEKIETSKSTVARWLQESAPIQPISAQPDPSIELELKRMQLNHELELRKLAQQEREQEYRRRDMERQYAMKQESEEVVDVELRKILLPIYKWASNQLELIKEYSGEGIPCTEDSLTDMSCRLEMFHETLSDYVHIRKLDEWDDVLNTLKSLNSKVGRWIIQLMKAEDAAREEFEYQNRRNARNEVHGLNLKDEYTSRKKKKKKHEEEEEEEEEFVFQAEIECHWGNSRSDLKYLVERVR
jgi:transcriptional regulator with XRE-family HTH domain